MSSDVIYLSEVSHAIDLKDYPRTNDVTHTNFNCKAVEVNEIDLTMVARIIDGDELKKTHDVPNNSRYCFAAIKKTFYN